MWDSKFGEGIGDASLHPMSRWLDARFMAGEEVCIILEYLFEPASFAVFTS